ncbi:MAG TPA: hypothetical protein DEP72_06525 [Clostridiales bacterium]|nr:MAG: hypothetical protein A2Y18_03580 [Clostridiales bacterium GWD2_32_19]HCC07793.1 hypothetical protein [Clostridiales bacterium]
MTTQIKISKSEITRDDFILLFSSDNLLEMYSLIQDGNVLITGFQKKPWGTWNIVGWFLCTTDEISIENSIRLAAGSTDWEYVFRVKDDIDADYIFSGGNHENEKMNSIEFLNGEDNSKIQLEIGKQTRVEKLNIVEYTSLLRPEDGSVYANVRRNYVVEPSRISLETDFEFVSDVFIGTSYVCMFPVSKEYGQYIFFGGDKDPYETPKHGETLTEGSFENYYGKKEALEAKIWGPANTAYKFRVSI